MTNVLVAGGTGFVGSHIAERLVADGCTVSSLSRHSPPEAGVAGVDYRLGDLVADMDLVAHFRGIDAVVFAATTTTPASAQGDPAYDAWTNLSAGIRVVEAAAEAAVEHLIFISSGGTVYGVPETVPIAETHPTEPISFYGVTKLALEKYFALAARDAGLSRVTILRVGNAFGERQDPSRDQGAAAAFLTALLDDRPVEIWGDGSVVRDYVYAGDVGDAVAASLRRASDRMLVANVGTGRGTSLLELLDACGRVVGVAPKLALRSERAFDVPVVVLDVARARDVLGWEARTSLETGLDREARWLEARRASVHASTP